MRTVRAPSSEDLSRRGIGLGTQHSVSEFAQRILQRAEQLGLNKLQLAKKAELSRQTLETTLQFSSRGDNTMPSMNTFLRLGHALRVHPAWLIEGLFCNVVVPMRIDVKMNAARSPNVEDINFPDGALVAPGSVFTKSWRVRNHSARAWQGLKLVCLDQRLVVISKRTGEPLYAADHLRADAVDMPLPDLLPCEGCEVHMGFTAPATNGTVISRWEAQTRDGAPLADAPFGVGGPGASCRSSLSPAPRGAFLWAQPKRGRGPVHPPSPRSSAPATASRVQLGVPSADDRTVRHRTHPSPPLAPRLAPSAARLPGG
ncbi:MAG: hypothetical protein RJA98_2660 [Pseudomonadota bacterium]